MTPPRLPKEILRRVTRLSTANGWSVVIVAGLCALLSLPFADFTGAAIGLLVAAGGTLEVHGSRLLRRGDAGGMRWLAGSQLVILVPIAVYVASRLVVYDAGFLRARVIPEVQAVLASCGMDPDLLLAGAGVDPARLDLFARLFVIVLFGSVLLASLLYQGGLWLYYRRNTAAVEEALTPPRIDRNAMP